MDKRDLVFVNYQERRCGQCGCTTKSPLQACEVVTGCNCQHLGWSSDYFTINADSFPSCVPPGKFVPRSNIKFFH